ncbi:hypothetical protein RD792_011873 [Penstemon davidsonii]|uniref:Ubiquitin thioesterase OTU n=1 Tax=Penstemon davidsonii TaxID=160366 RepID=A0ABR0CVC3_9LAMI|nr:hypothetical protein RD792_011873 [Penstemon davidsonii]
MATNPSNEDILQQLKHGVAHFEIVSSPVPSVSSHCTRNPSPFASLTNATHRFFARIGTSAISGSDAMKKVERYSVQRVTGDGRCLFRALVFVKGMALNKGVAIGPLEERESADELRMAVKEVICDNDKERIKYEEALIAITVEESLRRVLINYYVCSYCQRIGRPDFWGGEAELLVLSRLCSQPIVVYIPQHEARLTMTSCRALGDMKCCQFLFYGFCFYLLRFHKCLLSLNLQHGGWGSGFIPIQEYGSDIHNDFKKGKTRKVVRLLYTGRNHYDLLV